MRAVPTRVQVANQEARTQAEMMRTWMAGRDFIVESGELDELDFAAALAQFI